MSLQKALDYIPRLNQEQLTILAAALLRYLLITGEGFYEFGKDGNELWVDLPEELLELLDDLSSDRLAQITIASKITATLHQEALQQKVFSQLTLF